ncbi:hypothetical protein DSM19430T_02800 [Desulfovibrio psychrotolerans]|uniref:Uncharacterized protein n=1 Tax=Desulfovibrio psychrotolerans TaxID=415242 RepID=A0A7J0BPG9_9BACT|nr:hypothetical protein DSM19430T_02800 [Desulfovibrio psychrotolerans]
MPDGKTAYVFSLGGARDFAFRLVRERKGGILPSALAAYRVTGDAALLTRAGGRKRGYTRVGKD